jgi:hypothetical protein
MTYTCRHRFVTRHERQLNNCPLCVLKQFLEALRYGKVLSLFIGPLGATSLAGVLAQCKRLTHLHLEVNDLEDTGSLDCCSCLQRWSPLTSATLESRILGQSVFHECLCSAQR